MKKDTNTITIKITNITDAQAIAIESQLYIWEYLGGIGSSRWTSFFADGDGDFHPKIEVNGKKPQHTELIGKEGLWSSSGYKIDYDAVSWRLRELEIKDKKKLVSYIKAPIFINKIRFKFYPWIKKLWEKQI